MTTPTKAMQLYQLMRAGSHFLVAILLVKIGLQTATIGQYEWMLWLGAFCTTFWINALLQTMPFTYSTLNEERRAPFVRGTFLLFSAVGVLVLGLLLVAQKQVLPALTGTDFLPGLPWFLLHMIFHVGTYPVEIWYLIRQDGPAIVLWGVTTFLIAVVALLLPIYLTGSLQNGLICLSVLSALRWCFAAWLAFRADTNLPTRQELGTWLRTAAPMIGQALIGHLTISFDAWLLGQQQTDSATFALFRYASREFPLAQSMSTALGVSMLPLLSGAWIQGKIRDNLALMRHKTTLLMSIVFPVAVAAVAYARELFEWAFDPQFVAAAPIFCVYMLLTVTRVLLPNTLLIAQGNTRPLLVVSVLELCLKMVLGYTLFQAYGLIGLAWSAICCAVFEKAAVIAYVWRRYDVAPWSYTNLWQWLMWSGILVVTVCLA